MHSKFYEHRTTGIRLNGMISRRTGMLSRIPVGGTLALFFMLTASGLAQAPEVFLHDRNQRDVHGLGSPIYDFSLASALHLNEADKLQATYAHVFERRTIASLQVGASYYVYALDFETQNLCALQYLSPGHYGAPVCVTVNAPPGYACCGTQSLILHPDGTKLYVVVNKDNIVQVDIGVPNHTALTVNPNTLRLTNTGGGNADVHNMDITPDGKRLLAVGRDRLYDVDTKDATTGLLKQSHDFQLPVSTNPDGYYGFPIRISPNPAKPFALIGDPNGDGVYRINLVTLGSGPGAFARIAGPLGLGTGHDPGNNKITYNDIVFHDSGDYAYAASCASAQCILTGVGLIDVFGLSNGGTPTLAIRGGGPNIIPVSIHYNPAFHRLYVGYSSNVIGVVTFNVSANGSALTFGTSDIGGRELFTSMAVPQIPSALAVVAPELFWGLTVPPQLANGFPNMVWFDLDGIPGPPPIPASPLIPIPYGAWTTEGGFRWMDAVQAPGQPAVLLVLTTGYFAELRAFRVAGANFTPCGSYPLPAQVSGYGENGGVRVAPSGAYALVTLGNNIGGGINALLKFPLNLTATGSCLLPGTPTQIPLSSNSAIRNVDFDAQDPQQVVISGYSNVVTFVNPISGATLCNVPLNNGSQSLTRLVALYRPDGTEVWASSYDGQQIAVIAPPGVAGACTVTQFITAGFSANDGLLGPSFHPDPAIPAYYVGSYPSGNFFVLNTNTKSIGNAFFMHGSSLSTAVTRGPAYLLELPIYGCCPQFGMTNTYDVSTLSKALNPEPNFIGAHASSVDMRLATTLRTVGQPDLTITKTHSGNFTLGQTSANFLITVTNSGASATVGTVTVTDDLSGAPGLTAVNFSGNNWVCSGTTCTRSDPLAASASYDPILLTVSVGLNAVSPQVNHASVSGGGDVNTSNNTATDSVIVTQLPDLTIAKAHLGTGFTQSPQGAQYKLTVSNGGAGATTGSITVTDTLPVGLTFASGSGGGFSCLASGQLVTCTNSTTPIVAGGTATIALNVNVPATVGTSLTNSATVACTCTETNTANNTSNIDIVTVVQPVTVSPTTLSFGSQGLNSPTNAQTISVQNNQNSPASFSFSLTGPNPSDFRPVAMPTTCSNTLAAGASCTISYQFQPQGTGPRSVTLTFSGTPDLIQPTVSLTGTGVQPVTVTPITLAFGSQGLNSPTAAKTITVHNNQSSSTSLSFSLTGANLPDFRPVTTVNPCLNSLAAGASCTIGYQFQPQGLGPRSAVLSFSGTPDLIQPTVSLKGTGVQPVTVSPTTLAFGSQGLNSPTAAQTVTVHNNQSSSTNLSFSLTGANLPDFRPATTVNPCLNTLAAGASCTISYQFLPQGLGPRSAVLSFSGTPNTIQPTVSLKGTGVQPVTVTPITLPFGSQGLNSPTAAKTVTVHNNQSSSTNLSFSLTGANLPDFRPVTTVNPCLNSLAAGASCTIGYQFQPQGLGPRSATLTFSGTPNTIQPTVSLTGTGVQPVTVTPTTLAFGSQGLNSSTAAKTVTVHNNQSSPTGLSFSLTGANFADFQPVTMPTTCGNALAAGASCTISYQFRPQGLGTRSATLTFSGTPDTIQPMVSLTGTGI
jgi:Domain of unknown function DUF11/Cep192 domain 4